MHLYLTDSRRVSAENQSLGSVSKFLVSPGLNLIPPRFSFAARSARLSGARRSVLLRARAKHLTRDRERPSIARGARERSSPPHIRRPTAERALRRRPARAVAGSGERALLRSRDAHRSQRLRPPPRHHAGADVESFRRRRLRDALLQSVLLD